MSIDFLESKMIQGETHFCALKPNKINPMIKWLTIKLSTTVNAGILRSRADHDLYMAVNCHNNWASTGAEILTEDNL